MSTAQINNLLTLQEAAEKLNVSVGTLLSWNQENILKPTITEEGEIGYTQKQLDQFLTIRKIIQQTPQPGITQNANISLTSQITTATQHIMSGNTAGEASKSNYIKAPSPILTLSVAATVVVLTIAVLPQQILPTSRLNLSEKIISALPIQLKHEASSLQSVGERISKEKITAPALYEPEKDSTGEDSEILAMTASQKPTGEPVPYSYASSSYFPETSGDEALAIDKHGVIRGQTNKSDTMAIFTGGMDGMVQDDALTQINANATNQLIFLFIGALGVLFFLQKQFAFPAKRLQVMPTDSSFTDPYKRVAVGVQKVLEIDQKTDGTVVLNVQGKEYKISKPEMNSESDQFIEQLMELVQSGMKEIEFDTLASNKMKFTTPLSRLVTRLGFVGIKRDLFFPRTSKTSVLFRKYVTQEDLTNMNLTMSQIMDDLTALSN